MRRFFLAVVVALIAASPILAQQFVVGGTSSTTTANIRAALTTLGHSYTDMSGNMTPDPTGLVAGDFIIIGNDGGTLGLLDYTSFLNAGGHVIVAGGSNFQPYRDWVAAYFTTTDTGIGWHTDGAWHKTSSNQVNAFVPTDYSFLNSSETFHMVGFLASANTDLLGSNDEPVSIEAIRTFNNGGTFQYMALDIGGQYQDPTDQSSFIVPWLQGALNPGVGVPEPASLALMAAAMVTGVLVYQRRRKSKQARHSFSRGV